jgi:hypothetical protein
MAVMKRKLIGELAALALACLAGALSGCGSQTKTVSVAGAPSTAQDTTAGTTTQSTTSAPSTATTTTSTATNPTSSAGGTSTPGGTRTAPEPAFAEQEKHDEGEGLSEAAVVLKAHGYTPSDTSQYHPQQTLRVLVGTQGGSASGYGQQAFFFVDGRYIGTDTKEPSATVQVVSQNDTEVTLAYPLYRPGDQLSSPSGGQATVRFALNDGKLMALDPIPPAHSSTGLSRN